MKLVWRERPARERRHTDERRKAGATHLRKAPNEGEERECVGVVGVRQRCEDGELCSNPNDSQPDSERYLRANVHRTTGVFLEDGDDAKSEHGERPADPVLWAVAAEDLGGQACKDGEGGNDEDESEQVDARAGGGGAFGSLEVDGKVVDSRKRDDAVEESPKIPA